MTIQFRNRDLLSTQFDIYEIHQHKLIPIVITEAPLFSNSKLRQRIDRIKSFVTTLSEDQARRIAIAFESLQEETTATTNKKSFFLKKKADSQVSIIIHDGNLLLKSQLKEKNFWSQVGGFKTVSRIPGFLFSETLEEEYFVAKKMSTKPKSTSLDDMKISKESYLQCKTELETIEKLKIVSKPVLWFSYKNANFSANRLISIEPFCPYTFQSKEAQELSKKHIATLFSQITKQLLDIHNQDYFHGDIKSNNAIWRKGPGDIPIAIWTDFGNTESAQPSSITKNYWLTRGFYGTPAYAPPEVLGQMPFKGDIKTAEIWALGCIFIEFATNEIVPWAFPLTTLYNTVAASNFAPYYPSVIPIMTSIKHNLTVYEKRIKSLAPKLQAFAQIGLSLLKIDPQKRPSLQEVIDDLDQIKSEASL